MTLRKEYIKVSRMQAIITLIIVFIIIVLAIIFFTNKLSKHSDEMRLLVKTEINGTILVLKNEQRGSYYMEIMTVNKNHKIHSLPIAWEVNEYDIKVGDSISKEAGSRMMLFYKKDNVGGKKYCEFKIRD